MLTFVKFGGSVITDKTRPETPDLETIRSLAQAVQAARAAQPDLQLILSHGSGSFGHIYAQRYGIHRGLPPGSDWMGFALTAGAALRLNRIVVDELLAAGVPAISLQPSTTLLSNAGQLEAWDTAAIDRALAQALVPVIHGDVAFDRTQGTAIMSTEVLLEHLTRHTALRPGRIILVGEEGVFTADPRTNPDAVRIPQIDEQNIAQVLQGVGGSHGVDVTGGMRSKVELMWRLVEHVPELQVYLIGPHPELFTGALRGQALPAGTLIARRML